MYKKLVTLVSFLCYNSDLNGMQVEKKVKEFAVLTVIKAIAQLCYFAGLTALIPLLPIFLSPTKLIEINYVLYGAVALILVGFFIVYFFAGSKQTAFRTLGYTTLVPGLIAVFTAYTGPRRMVKFMELFGDITPVVKFWIETHVPQTWLLAGIYIILGSGLVWISYQVKKKSLF